MTRTNNDELVEIALKIAAADAAGNALRDKAGTYPVKSPVRNDLEKRARSTDNDICQLCTDLRNACLPVAA